MNTKIILAGGYMSKAADYGAEFCKEVVKYIDHPVRILECLFGLNHEAWEEALEREKQMFLKALPNIKIQFLIADKTIFVSQIKNADIICFRGGNTQQLYYVLKEIAGWQETIRDKIVVGTSAGAYILSEFYVHASESPELKRGFGLVQTKTVAHYRSDFLHKDNPIKSKEYWRKVDDLLDSSESHLNSTKLAEGEYKIFIRNK